MVKKRNIVIKKKKKNGTSKKKTGVSSVGRALRMLGGVGGGALGSLAGLGGIGSSVGTELGATLSRWLGAGDYTVAQNSLVSSMKSTGSIPSMHKTGQSITVRHKEYIRDIPSSTAFAVIFGYALNPGLASSFPWLAGIAQQYQEYRWKGIVYHYVPTSGSAIASTNNALGTVMMATHYKATAAAFTGKQQMLNEYFSSDSRPSDAFCHPIECDPRENPFNVQYVRSGAVPTGEDQRLYDLGVMYLGTEGMQAADIDVGELWVSYEVELKKPILSNFSGSNNQSAHYYNTTGVSAAAPFGTAASIVKLFDSLPSVMTFTSTKMTWAAGSAGSYLVAFGFTTVTASTLTTFISGGTLVNCTFKLFTGGSASGNGLTTTYTTGTFYAVNVGIFTITNPYLVASFTPNPSTLTGVAGMDVIITQTLQGLY